MKGRPDDWTNVVREHAHSTLAIIVSTRHPNCLKMAADEVKYIDRWMTRATVGDLPDTVPESWFMAVIVCPDDDLVPLAKWMSKHGASRVRFYLHRDAKPNLLGPIRDAGHELRHVRADGYASYGRLHKRLGLDLSDQIYEDFRPA